MSDFSDLAAVGQRAVRKAGEVLRANVHAPSSDGGRTNRRIADIKSLAADTMRSTILQEFPDHAFLELAKPARPGTPTVPTWYANPLQGEFNYVRGLKLFAVSLALEIDDRTVLGLVYDPAYDRCYVAQPGGANVNGEEIEVSGAKQLGRSLVSLENPPPDRLVIGSVSAATRGVRMLGSLSLAMALLAAGNLEVVFARQVACQDAAAGIFLVQRAGGVVTTLEGRPFDTQSSTLVATNGHLHDAFLRLVNAHG